MNQQYKSKAEMSSWELPDKVGTFISEFPTRTNRFLMDHLPAFTAIFSFCYLNQIGSIPQTDFGLHFYLSYIPVAVLGFWLAVASSTVYGLFNLLRGGKLSLLHMISETINLLGWCAAYIGLPSVLVRRLADPVYALYQRDPQTVVNLAISIGIFTFFLCIGLFLRSSRVIIIEKQQISKR